MASARAGIGLMANRYAPIEDYGVIGDLHTVALVGKDASIDFLCLPSFDSPSVFAALLDADRGGRFQIAPQLDDAVHRQLYLPDTNVLLTRFLSDGGVAEVSDFMPVEDAGVAHNLVRRAKTVRGEVRFGMRCDPRFDYARATHTVAARRDRNPALERTGASAGTSGVSGIETSVLKGDPTAGGLYTILLRVPPNTRIQAHTHPDDRIATVVSGTWHFGYGGDFDESKLKVLPPGSFYTEPPALPHFARTGDEPVVLQITGVAPTGTQYVQEPAN